MPRTPIQSAVKVPASARLRTELVGIVVVEVASGRRETEVACEIVVGRVTVIDIDVSAGSGEDIGSQRSGRQRLFGLGAG